MSARLRRKATAATLQFHLYTADGTALQPSATIASGDVKIIKDGGTAANTTNLPTNEGQGCYSIALTSTEMDAERITVTLDDATATETFLGTAIQIETFGSLTANSSTISFDLGDTAIPANITEINNIADGVGSLSLQASLIEGASAVTDGSNTSTSFETDLTSSVDDLYKYRVIKFISGTNAGQYGFIRAYDGTTKFLTTTDLGFTPTSSDQFIIV